jgi:hypothetical protein
LGRRDGMGVDRPVIGETKTRKLEDGGGGERRGDTDPRFHADHEPSRAFTGVCDD